MEKFYKRFTCKKWRNFFHGDFHVKLKVSFEFFIRDFPGKKINWKKFLKGFLWKIEAEGKILKGFPFKFTTWLVLHVLHFIGNFFYNPRASLARTAFPLKLSLIPAIDLMKWKVKKVKVKSEVIFGPLNFFNLRYIKGGVRGNNNIGIKKCTTIFLWVLNLEQVGGRRNNF